MAFLRRLFPARKNDWYEAELAARNAFLSNDENKRDWDAAINVLLQTQHNFNARIPPDIGRAVTHPWLAHDELCWRIRNRQRECSLPYGVAAWQVIDGINEEGPGNTSQREIDREILKIHMTRRQYARWRHAAPRVGESADLNL